MIVLMNRNPFIRPMKAIKPQSGVVDVVDPPIEAVVPNADIIDEKAILKDMCYFNNSSHSKHIKEVLRLQKKIKKFESKIAVVLKATSERPLGDVISFVLQSAEDYLVSELATKEVKMDVCVRLLTQYIGNDVELCDDVIQIAMRNIKPSTMYRRNKKHLYKVGSFFLSKLSSHN